MPIYHRLGKIPAKRHTVFRQKNGNFYAEHLMGNKGFGGISALLYHIRPPVTVRQVRCLREIHWVPDVDKTLRLRHFFAGRVEPAASMSMDRTPLLFNEDVALSLVCPTNSDDFFYRNSQGDELIFVSDGHGVLESIFGTLAYRQGDYIVIPRGIIHRFVLGAGNSRFLIMESRGYIRTPAQYRNEHGQLMEDSPFCERDIRRPEKLPLYNEKGAFPIRVKQRNAIHEIVLDHHPFDVVGWDGYYYPWIFSIHDFEPRVGRVHLPPPVHQTFESDGFVVCSFVPRLFDFHPQAVPAPYNHTNVMSDEVLYYAKGNFMSRKGIEYGSVTFHPDGLPHGPHPGRTEASIGQTRTDELAVMVDTFRPLQVARDILPFEDEKYHLSWLEDK